MSVVSENCGHLSVNSIQTLQNFLGVSKKKERKRLQFTAYWEGGGGGNFPILLFEPPLTSDSVKNDNA